MRFEGRRVLVTGGSRGIGAAVVSAFAAQGAHVAVHSSREPVQVDAPHVAVTGDVAEPQDVERFVAEAVERLGGLDVLVNNAGIYVELDLLTASYDDWQSNWRRTVDVNLLGPAWVTFCALPHLRASGRGKVVNVGSRGASRGEPVAVAYGAAKAGLTAMGQSLAQALASHGVSVGNVLPGFIETDMAAHVLDSDRGDGVRAQSPAGRVGRPEEVAQAVLFFAADGSEWSTGAVLDVNGASYLRT
ncbi:MAG: 3-oxoacyl-[acyl-carrier protein] reductase [Actinomycetota bacterium]|jgi:NAD(P)-dependent dehydrogenase (short-subunit alcohol dehydrogenase family)|nr:3-oxoacyl-[acyl-carrier protein] reductase [Actinomycetota bacterium]